MLSTNRTVTSAETKRLMQRLRSNKGNRKAFVDMDGVLVDFDKGRSESDHPVEVYKLTPGAYRNLEPIAGAIESVTKLIELDWDVWIATKIPTDNPYAAAEKLFWIWEHMPWMWESVIITPNKGCLGDIMDVLVDDRPHKAHISEFKGTVLTFGLTNKYQSWDQLFNEYFNVQIA